MRHELITLPPIALPSQPRRLWRKRDGAHVGYDVLSVYSSEVIRQ